MLSFSENTPLMHFFFKLIRGSSSEKKIFGAVARKVYTWYDISTYTMTGRRRNICSKASVFFFQGREKMFLSHKTDSKIA